MKARWHKIATKVRLLASALIMVLPLAAATPAHAATVTVNMHLLTGPNPSAVGQQVGMYVMSDILPSWVDQAPTGNVLIYDGSSVIMNVDVSEELMYFDGGPRIFASFPYTFTTAGTHTLHAVYSGTPSGLVYYSGATTPNYDQIVTDTVAAGTNYPTTTSTRPAGFPDNNHVPYGMVFQDYTTVATALDPTSTDIAVPTGSVNVSVDGQSVAGSPIGPRLNQPLVSAVASTNIPLVGLGTHTVDASYAGDSTYPNQTFEPSATTSSRTFTVVQAGTLAQLSAFASGAGTATVNAVVFPSAAGTASGICDYVAPTGTVQILENDNVLATTNVTDDGTPQCHSSLAHFKLGLTPGTHKLTEVYSGDSHFLGSSSQQVAVTVSGTPLAMSISAPQSVDATSPQGAPVNFSTNVTGGVAPYTTACSPVSGDIFPIGTTTINCTTTDGAFNQVTASATVNVVGAPGELQDLLQAVTGVGPGSSFATKISSAEQDLSQTPSNVPDACTTLQAFINQVNAQSGKSITTAQATTFIQEANQIRAVLGC